MADQPSNEQPKNDADSIENAQQTQDEARRDLENEALDNIAADSSTQDKNEPAAIAGLTQEQLRMSTMALMALVQSPEFDPDAAESARIRNIDDANEYGFGTKAAMKQYNDALSGAGHASTTFSASLKTKAHAEEENLKKTEARVRAALVAAGVQSATEQLMGSLERIDFLSSRQNALLEQIKLSVSAVEELVQELEQEGRPGDAQIIRDVEEMRSYVVISFKGEEKIVFKDEDDPDARYVIDSETGERVYINEMKPEVRDQAWEDIQKQDGQKFGNEDPERVHELETSTGRLYEDPELLIRFQKVDGDRYELLTQLHSLNIELKQEIQDAKDMIASGQKDGTLDQAQVDDLVKRIHETDVSQGDKATLLAYFANEVVESDIMIKDKNGNVLGGQDALKYITGEYDRLNQEIEQRESVVAHSVEQIEAMRAKDAEGVNLAERSVTHNQSLMVGVVKDINGNEVHFDEQEYAFYRMEQNKAIYYHENDPQIAEFTRVLQSQNMSPSPAVPGLSSVQAFNASLPLFAGNTAPVMRFANQDINNEARELKTAQHIAQGAIKVLEGQKNDLLAQLSQEQRETLLAQAESENKDQQQDGTWDANEQLNLEADPEYMMTMGKVEARIGGLNALTREDLNLLLTGTSPQMAAKIEDTLKHQGVEIQEAPGNHLFIGMKPQPVASPSIAPDTYGVQPGVYTSFADNEFNDYTPAGTDSPTYLVTKVEAPEVRSGFGGLASGQTPAQQPAMASGSTGTGSGSGNLTPEDLEKLGLGATTNQPNNGINTSTGM